MCEENTNARINLLVCRLHQLNQIFIEGILIRLCKSATVIIHRSSVMMDHKTILVTFVVLNRRG